MTIYAITGDSGTGKSNIVGEYLNSRGITKLITSTERPPREGEVDGVHYHFKGKGELREEDLVEFTNYAGYKYGTSIEELENLLEKSPNIYVILDQKGIRSFKDKYGDEVVTIKITTDVIKMVERLRKRGDKDSEIVSRVQQWHKERDYVDLFKYDYRIDNNSNIVTEVTDYIDKILEDTMA